MRIDKIKTLSETFIESNQSLNLTNFKFVENTIFVFSKEDINKNLESEHKVDIINKYFIDSRIKQTKDKICETSKDILSIYQDGKNMEKFSNEYGSSISKFINNRITNLSLLYNNFTDNECDIQKIFNNIKLDSTVIFSKISIRRKKQYYKIFKPLYFGDDAVTKKTFNSWRNIDFSNEEKDNFDTKWFFNF